MADPRLQWRSLEVSQPNVAALMRGANDSLMAAGEAAKGILASYDKGQMQAGDQELARLLASATSQEELTSLANSEQIRGLRLSADGTKMLNQAQQGIADWQNTHSIMTDRAGRLGIAQDINRRDAADWQWNDGRRREMAGLTDEYVAARLEGQQFGANGRPTGGAFENYINSTINSESGGDPNAKNPLSSATGLAQFTKGTWDQMMAKHPDLGLTADGRTDPAQATRALRRFTEDNMRFLESNGIPINEGTLYQAHFLGAGGARAVAEAPAEARMVDIMPPEVIRANPFLQGMTKASFERWAMEKGGGNAPAASRTPAVDTFRDAVANSQYMSLDDVAGLLNQQDGYQKEGDDKIGAQLAQERRDLLAALTQEAVANPENISTADAAREVATRAAESGKFTSSEELEAVKAVEELIAGSSTLQTELAPSVAQDLETDRLIADTLADERRRFEGTDINRAIGDIGRYTEDPTKNLEADLGIGADGETPSGYDSNDLRNYVNELAAKFNVEPAVVAVAMRDAFERDPGRGGFPGDWTRNSIPNRFDEEKIAETVRQITPDSRALYDEGQSNLTIMEGQLRQVQAQRDQIRTRLAKLPEDSPRRSALEAQLLALDAQLESVRAANTNRP